MRFPINLAIAIAFSLTAPRFVAAGDAWDRMGRLWGYGWSDGYHACGDAPYVPGENLPPHDFAEKQTQCCEKGCSPVKRCGPCNVNSVCASGTCSATNCTSGNCTPHGGTEDWLPETWHPANLVPTVSDPTPMVLPPTPSTPGRQTPKSETLPAPQAEEDPLSWEKQPSKIGKFVSTRLTSLLR
jgi:hypothetical protein